MRITASVYNEICEDLRIVPPERGGVIGSEHGVVCTFYLDDGAGQAGRYVYVPDVNKLNGVIAQWAEKGIGFAGMFHSHPSPQTDLSIADEEYIINIMEAMPGSVSELHFPVIVPGMGMTGHLAKRRAGEVIIVPEEIIIEKE